MFSVCYNPRQTFVILPVSPPIDLRFDSASHNLHRSNAQDAACPLCLPTTTDKLVGCYHLPRQHDGRTITVASFTGREQYRKTEACPRGLVSQAACDGGVTSRPSTNEPASGASPLSVDPLLACPVHSRPLRPRELWRCGKIDVLAGRQQRTAGASAQVSRESPPDSAAAASDRNDNITGDAVRCGPHLPLLATCSHTLGTGLAQGVLISPSQAAVFAPAVTGNLRNMLQPTLCLRLSSQDCLRPDRERHWCAQFPEAYTDACHAIK